MILYKRYSPEEYPAYDNYDAINVDRIAEIPMDLDRAMGVPITFLDKHNPEQFEIMGITASADRYGLKTKKYTLADAPNYSYLNSREGGVMRVGGRYTSTYRRLLVKRVPPAMKIDLKKITVRDLVENYHDDGEGGVRGYGGKLDIRPPFQREFVYKDKQRDAVIETINKDFPLNVMYWAVRQDGTYEVIDGQQRTISAAQYVERRLLP